MFLKAFGKLQTYSFKTCLSSEHHWSEKVLWKIIFRKKVENRFYLLHL